MFSRMHEQNRYSCLGLLRSHPAWSVIVAAVTVAVLIESRIAVGRFVRPRTGVGQARAAVAAYLHLELRFLRWRARAATVHPSSVRQTGLATFLTSLVTRPEHAGRATLCIRVGGLGEARH